MKIYPYPSEAAEKRVSAIIDRGLSYSGKDYQDVVRMLEDVRKNGDEAVIRYTNRFDSPDLTADHLEVTDREIKAARKMVDGAFMRALNRAASQIESFHRHQVANSWIQTDRPGVILGQMVNPVDAAGIYVPGAKGGETPLVSSVLMGGIPARIAGVKTIAMVTPPTRDGSINPHLLAAARIAGIHKIYKAGSAWAIAALAYGTKTIPKVNVIVGPGNIYVTLAKKIVAGTVGIDMIAGPSEILVIADGSADPEYIAADLLSQAEHDPLASAILITDQKEIAKAVRTAVMKQLDSLKRSDIARASIQKYGGIMLVPDLAAAIDLANRIAPEHLELQVENPFDWVGRIRNAGAVFLGNYTPEPVGDYVAGPNHVLPTAGTAKFASALSVDHFVKKTSIIHYSEGAFKKEAKDIMLLAETEGLDAHARSVKVRLKKR
ncbi:MAG: histidinol dehydrogenase [Desulfobacteraceae bacterium]|nr:MAG: histidinol dehydrogenase [Desulfobacteraceae bacterium]